MLSWLAWRHFDVNVFGMWRAVESGGSTRNSREDLYGSRNYRGSNSSLNDGRLPSPLFLPIVIVFCILLAVIATIFHLFICLSFFFFKKILLLDFDFICFAFYLISFIWFYFFRSGLWQLNRTKGTIRHWCIPAGRVAVSWQVTWLIFVVVDEMADETWWHV